MDIQDRVIKLVRVKASKLRPSPWNFRTHPEKQRAVLKAVLGEVGIAGAVLARELEDGTYALIDGHLRREELGNRKIPVLVVDLDEDEAKKLLACYDPIGALAGVDADRLDALLAEVDTGEESLASLFSEMASRESVKDLKLDTGDGADEDGEESSEDVGNGLPASHVRMVQLFLNTETLPLFEEYVKVLGSAYDTKSLTATVLEALRRAVRRVKKEVS